MARTFINHLKRRLNQKMGEIKVLAGVILTTYILSTMAAPSVLSEDNQSERQLVHTRSPSHGGHHVESWQPPGPKRHHHDVFPAPTNDHPLLEHTRVKETASYEES
jgi:hypothetical protein